MAKIRLREMCEKFLDLDQMSCVGPARSWWGRAVSSAVRPGAAGRRPRALPKSPYIRHYIECKKKNLATFSIARFLLIAWCRRDESNTRPSHYE